MRYYQRAPLPDLNDPSAMEEFVYTAESEDEAFKLAAKHPRSDIILVEWVDV